MSYDAPIIPETAPFNTAQRAWLNGWLAAYYGASASVASPSAAVPVNAAAGAMAPAAEAAPVSEEDENFPWHDMTLPLDERMQLAEGRPMPQRLMAAMAQQDCGQCSYLCRTYAEAIASGAETALNRCVPGGKETARMVKELLELGAPPATAAPVIAAAVTPAPAVAPAASASDKTERRAARLEGALPLNGAGSAKDTRHVVFDLKDTGLTYEVGDALGVMPTNCPRTVDAIIACLGAKPSDEVQGPDGVTRPLIEALLYACDIGRPSDESIEVLASRARILDESQRLQALAEGYPGASHEGADLLELLQTFRSARPPLQELISSLSALQARLYSISSSPKAVKDAVTLTVAAVRYKLRRRPRIGIASTYLADRAGAGATVPVFVQKAHSFHIPDNHDTPMIMIGPGTGVAPFRAFLQERRAVGAKGRNWLFFGDQCRGSDFLYEDEIAEFQRDGLLSELDLAFSRDQAERIYVQHRMRDRAHDIWAWLQDGASVFVCGSMTMGKDVDAALAAIIARQGNMGTGAAKAYLATLTREKRYLKDVY
jgi:sulfite reductase (NADPH) flavoprotein alpha-component